MNPWICFPEPVSSMIAVAMLMVLSSLHQESGFSLSTEKLDDAFLDGVRRELRTDTLEIPHFLVPIIAGFVDPASVERFVLDGRQLPEVAAGGGRRYFLQGRFGGRERTGESLDRRWIDACAGFLPEDVALCIFSRGDITRMSPLLERIVGPETHELVSFVLRTGIERYSVRVKASRRVHGERDDVVEDLPREIALDDVGARGSIPVLLERISELTRAERAGRVLVVIRRSYRGEPRREPDQPSHEGLDSFEPLDSSLVWCVLFWIDGERGRELESSFDLLFSTAARNRVRGTAIVVKSPQGTVNLEEYFLRWPPKIPYLCMGRVPLAPGHGGGAELDSELKPNPPPAELLLVSNHAYFASDLAWRISWAPSQLADWDLRTIGDTTGWKEALGRVVREEGSGQLLVLGNGGEIARIQSGLDDETEVAPVTLPWFLLNATLDDASRIVDFRGEVRFP